MPSPPSPSPPPPVRAPVLRRLGAALPWAGAVASGLLLAASFPPLGRNEAAWVALVPLLLAVRRPAPGRGFRLGLVAGLAFWVPSLAWLRHVTAAGWLTLAGYCALYLGLFAVFAARWLRRAGGRDWTRNLAFMLLAPAVWVALEFVRSELFTGFPWNTLGTSQYDLPPVLQSAAWGGVYAVSALLVFFNAAVAVTVLRYTETRLRPGRGAHPELMLALLAMACALSFGSRAMRADGGAYTAVRIGLVQPSIPQVDKWDEHTADLIADRLRELSGRLHGEERVSLVVWPETALPDEVRYSEPSYRLVQELSVDRVPLLVGTMDAEPDGADRLRYFNSSFLFDTDGALAGRYDKQHLVMFGEYTPLPRLLPFLRAMTPVAESFTAGTESTVLRLDEPPVPFAVLICFEDTVARLARAAVRGGARLLVNQTNDAWFERSSASRQHMAHCVLRCVENRVPAVRCANTGITCHIDHRGVVRPGDLLRDASGDTFAPGVLAPWVLVPSPDRPPTFYTRYGDLFAWACVAAVLLHAAAALRRRRGLTKPT